MIWNFPFKDYTILSTFVAMYPSVFHFSTQFISSLSFHWEVSGELLEVVVVVILMYTIYAWKAVIYFSSSFAEQLISAIPAVF
jgi:hypothetical protein